MKLIRLTTLDQNARFDCNFSNDILLKPYSQIALQNVSVESQNNQIIVDDTNNEVDFQVSSSGAYGGVKTIQLEKGTFDANNYTDLLDDLTSKLNKTVISAGKGLGLQWRANINSNNKVEVGYKISQESEFDTDWTLVNIVRSATQYQSTGGPVTTNANYMYLEKPITKGGGRIKFRIRNINKNGADDQNGFILALSLTDPSTFSGPVDSSNIDYGIRGIGNGDAYEYILLGTSFATGTNLNYTGSGNATNDTVSLEISEGKIKFKIYQDDGAGGYNEILLNEEDYDSDFDLYPVIIFRGGATSNPARFSLSTSTLRYTDDPYLNSVSRPLELDGELGSTTPPSQSRVATLNYLDFKEESLANFLGFNFKRIPITGTNRVIEALYTADRNFDATDVSDAFVVELLNINLNSFSFDVNKNRGEKKNILAVIPQSDTNNQLIYDTQYPLFLDINNSETINLSTIQARILKSDLSELSIRGLATMTLLVKDS